MIIVHSNRLFGYTFLKCYLTSIKMSLELKELSEDNFETKLNECIAKLIQV